MRTGRWMCVAAIMSLAAGVITGCQTAGTADSEVPSAVTEGQDTLLWGPEIKDEALRMIDESAVFCHLTMYELGDPDVLAALARARSRGVDVKVVLDATEPHSQSVGLPYLRRHGIEVRSLRVPGGISHIKSLVTDDAGGMRALLGGMNFGSQSWSNHDASVYIAKAGSSFEGLFEEDFARAGGLPEPSLRFPPPLLYDGQIERALLSAIGNAAQSVVIEAFAFTSRDLIAALAAAVSRGVSVEVILDPGQSYNRKTARELERAGVRVRFYAPYQGEYLHAKIVSVDHGKEFFVGSANFSFHGFSVNHEGDVELTDAPAFARSFEADASLQYGRGQDASQISGPYGEYAQNSYSGFGGGTSAGWG
jgi:cardiolipin synthase